MTGDAASDDAAQVDVAEALRILTEGSIELLGLLPNASNYTFLVRIREGERVTLAVYKPRAGETPLWDFPDGTLCLREVAAFHVSEALGFELVPPTVLREGPHGIGSVQWFVDADPGHHYLTLPAEFDDAFKRVCLFDLLINNADRKSGHCLLDVSANRIWVVDHGVGFHAQPKLRTVIWDYEGQVIPDDSRDAVRAFAERLVGEPEFLAELLSSDERSALARRASQLCDLQAFPGPGPGRPYPWPPV